MRRRAGLWFVGACAVLVTLGTLSYTPGVTLDIADVDGAPAADAYVRYHYEGTLINLVHPVTYVARGSVIARADVHGRLAVPGRVHVRRPFPVSSPPTLFIDFVYVPRLHNAFGPIAKMTSPRPGVFDLDKDRTRLSVYDVSRNPELWERSLRELFDNIRTAAGSGSYAPAVVGHEQTRSHARELVSHLQREYAAFLDQYGQTLRERPSAPPPYASSEEDRKAWKERVEADYAREPQWGPFVQRMWRFNLAELDALEARLK